MKEITATVLGAARWYKKHGDGQYNDGSIGTYDKAAKILTRREDFAERLVEHIGTTPGKTLEIAAGTGLISKTLSHNFPNIVYTDYEGSATRILRSRLGSEAVVQADFYNLPFADDSFDTVVNVGGYRYVVPEKKEEFWDGLDRVVKPKGRVFIAQFYPRASSLQGLDIMDDSSNIGPHFALESTVTFDAKIPLGALQVRSGTYRSFEFRHTR